MADAPVLTQDNVLALLEPGPQSTTDLAAWCEVDARQMTHKLGQLAALGLVKRHSRTGHWHRLVIAPAAIAEPAAVLAQIEFAPKAAPEIGRMLSRSREAVDATLAQLQAAGQVKRVGSAGMRKWALAHWTAANVQKTHAVGRSVKRRPAAEQRLALGSSSGIVPADAFTAVRPKPAKTPIDDTGVAWWVAGAAAGAPREIFTTAQRRREDEMTHNATWRRQSKVQLLGWLGMPT